MTPNEGLNLYTLRYRQGSTGVQTTMITASSNAKAEEVGHWFCNQVPNRRFIRVDPAISASESDLEVPKEEPTKAQNDAAKSAAAGKR